MNTNLDNIINTILLGDCLDRLKEVPDNSIDAIITDPPYNVSRDNNFATISSAKRVGMDFGDWDYDFNIADYIPTFARVLKQNANIVIFNSWENLGTIKQVCEQNNIYMKRCLVLSKSNPAPFNRDRMFVNDVEFALWGVYNSTGKPTKWVFNRKNPVEKCVFDTTVQSSKLHPTMKDEKVMDRLIQLLTNEGDVVLDPFVGSGTTALSCSKFGRKYIGIEKEPKYWQVAIDRLKEFESQTRLFY